MYSDVTQFVRSSTELGTLLSEIEIIKKALFDSGGGGVDEVLASSVRESVASIFKEKFKKEAPEKYLEGLESELSGLQEIRLTLASELSGDQMENVYSWVSANVGQGVIVNVELDPKILGGAVITFKGKYYDGSLVKTVEELLQKNKDSVVSKILNFK